MECFKLSVVAVLLLTVYASSCEGYISCYTCSTKHGSKSAKSGSKKDGCHPDNLGGSSQKSGSRADESSPCDYCLTITTHYESGKNEYFTYDRSCRLKLSGVLTNGCEAKAAGIVLGRVEYSGSSVTTTCCDDENLCNKNSASPLQGVVLTVLVLLTVYRLV